MQLFFLSLGLIILLFSSCIWKDFASGLVGFIVGGTLFWSVLALFKMMNWLASFFQP